MILNKDENIEEIKSEREAKGEDEQYVKSNQQSQKHQKVIAAETKTKEKEKENQGEIKHQQENKVKTNTPAKQIR